MKFKIVIVLLFSFFTINSSAQKTEKVKNNLPNGLTEEYYVLTDSNSVKQGAYILKDQKGKLYEKGNYLNGAKEGLWETYSWEGTTTSGTYKNGLKEGMWKEKGGSGNYLHDIKSGEWKEMNGTGNYLNGNRSGEWIFTSKSGKKEQIYDYTISKIVWYDSTALGYSPIEAKILINGDSQTVKLDHAPLYIGGNDALSHYISYTLRYPIIEKEMGKQGTVYVTYDVDSTGKILNFRIAKGVANAPGLAKESIRVLELTSGSWYPATYQGNPISMSVTQAVRFVLQ
ncbi:hypothetical protein BH09BAC5_BH09BAC5_03900 [soil metagenome]